MAAAERINGTEDRGINTNAERQRDERNQRRTRPLQKLLIP